MPYSFLSKRPTRFRWADAAKGSHRRIVKLTVRTVGVVILGLAAVTSCSESSANIGQGLQVGQCVHVDGSREVTRAANCADAQGNYRVLRVFEGGQDRDCDGTPGMTAVYSTYYSGGSGNLSTLCLGPISAGSPTVAPYVPSVPTPTLDPASINNIFESYMNGLQDHNLDELHSATCPELRHTEVGFELHGYYVNGWKMLPYQVAQNSDYVTVQATVNQQNTDSGESVGTITYSWYVEKVEDGNYYVCGWLG